MFTGYIKTTDGKKWGVAFRALSWSDAHLIAEQCNAVVDGKIIYMIDDESGDRLEPRSCLAAWEFNGEQFVTEVGE